MQITGERICGIDTCPHLPCIESHSCKGIEFRENHALPHIEAMAKAIVKDAELYGVVLTIESVPRQPLAMGNHEMVVSVRRARGEV